MHKLIVIAACAVLIGCAGSRPGPGGLIIDTKGVDMEAYRVDLMECNDYADQVSIAGHAGAGAAGSAVVGAIFGAVVGDSELSKRAAGGGAVLGGARGTVDGVREQRAVVRNCMSQRGYKVLN